MVPINGKSLTVARPRRRLRAATAGQPSIAWCSARQPRKQSPRRSRPFPPARGERPARVHRHHQCAGLQDQNRRADHRRRRRGPPGARGQSGHPGRGCPRGAFIDADATDCAGWGLQVIETGERDHGYLETLRYRTLGNLDAVPRSALWKGLNIIGLIESQHEGEGETSTEHRF